MGNARKILIIDDDDELRDSLSEQLSLHEEFDTLLAANASDGLKLARNGHVDLVLLDVGLPDLDGREACKLLRRSGFKGPVVMLTGQATDSDTILGLELGANDYVTKPFKLGVLLARIRAQLRQHEQSEDAVFTIGPYTFKPASKLLVDGGGGKIRLTEKETSILKYLYRAGERVVTRDVLLHEVWGYNAGVTTHTLETHIYRLRQKIEKDPVAGRAADHRDRRLQARALAFPSPLQGEGENSSNLEIGDHRDMVRRARPVPRLVEHAHRGCGSVERRRGPDMVETAAAVRGAPVAVSVAPPGEELLLRRHVAAHHVDEIMRSLHAQEALDLGRRVAHHSEKLLVRPHIGR